MTNYIVTDSELTAVAGAIRTKGGTQSLLEWPDGFADAVDDIQTAGYGVYAMPGGGFGASLTTTSGSQSLSLSNVASGTTVYVGCFNSAEKFDPSGIHAYNVGIGTELQLSSVAGYPKLKSFVMPSANVSVVDLGTGNMNTCSVTIDSEGYVTCSDFDRTPSLPYFVLFKNAALAEDIPLVYYSGYLDAYSGTAIGQFVAFSENVVASDYTGYLLSPGYGAFFDGDSGYPEQTSGIRESLACSTETTGIVIDISDISAL